MKNRLTKIFLILISVLLIENSFAKEEFNFNVTEIEITNGGNIFKGLKRGTITTNDGISLNANEFEYNKQTNILKAQGNVEVYDEINNYVIYSENVTFYKNQNIIITKEKSKAISQNDNVEINSEIFEYHKSLNKIIAKNNVIVDDKNQNHKIFANEIIYFQNQDKYLTKGKTRALIESKYDFNSEDVIYLKKEMKLSSKKKTTIFDDNSQFYKLSNFIYLISDKQLKGENILVTTNYNLPKSDKFYFSSAIINLENNNFIAQETEVKVHKSIFDNIENDPRILGVSSKKDGDKTIINKAIFTSCKKNENCTPWSISADTIEHDKKKKQITYEHAFLRIYDKPVLYFPKFFHPDPSVIRQSGFLTPSINHSDILGSSFTQPYFSKISDNKDITFRPSWFDNDILSFQNEFRQVNEKSTLLADFGFVKGFKSKTTNKRKNLNHFFINFDYNLELEDFISSNLFLNIEKTNNDGYLKIFDPHITKSKARPDSFNTLKNNLEIILNHENYNFTTGILSYENLQEGKTSDRYQYVLPYYNFDKSLDTSFLNGSWNFSSSGNNNLNKTNQLKSNIINNVSYSSQNYFTESGISNTFNFNFKNLNSIGKNYSGYKNSPQMELLSIFSFDTNFPLQKVNDDYEFFLTPSASFRLNPGDMKNYSTSNQKINVGNVFNLNRLGLSDTFEAGRSLTLGIDYKKEKINSNLNSQEEENLENINKYFEIKLATVLRDKEENFIPKKSTINRKNSNLFGSIDNSLFENFKIKYNFALDNDFNKLEYSNLATTLKFEDLETTFKFIEENGEIGDSNVVENITEYNFDNSNSIKFKTRRNRKINLTEYYDLVYEYKNDCLTAGIKYKKTYYEDRDLKPTENLLFTVTLFPLTTYEYSADELLQN